MKITYWTSTIFVVLFLLWSAYSYVFSKATIDGIKALGFPDFFRVQLAVLKVLAVIIIVIPAIPLFMKDFAYVGVALFFVTAIVAHVAHKDPFIITLINISLICILIVSYIYLHKINTLI